MKHSGRSTMPIFILTYLPPLNGEVQSVKIVGSQNNE
jgi:hypothetical protein